MDNLTREQILKERIKWYSQTFVKFEIIKCLHHRELCFLSAKGEEKKRVIRYLLAFNLLYLDKHLKFFNFDKSLLNMYQSVSILKNVYVFSYNLRIRKEDTRYKEFNKNYKDYVVGYDFFVDFDGKENFKKCYKETKEFKKILEDFKVPYYLLNSSFNGFHFHIPCEYMPKMEINELLNLIQKVMSNIKYIYDFTCLDDSIVDIKRVCKTSYSYSCDGSICLPLSDEQFKNFTPEMVKMENVIKKIQIKNRGLLGRDWGLSKEQLQQNVLKFLNDFK